MYLKYFSLMLYYVLMFFYVLSSQKLKTTFRYQRYRLASINPRQHALSRKRLYDVLLFKHVCLNNKTSFLRETSL